MCRLRDVPKVVSDPLASFRSPPECSCLERPLASSLAGLTTGALRLEAPSMGFCAPSAFLLHVAAAYRSGLPHPSTCILGFSQPLDAFLRPVLTGLVSCRIRSWGFPSELCSSRAAVRRLQRRCPLVVPATSSRCIDQLRPLRASTACTHRPSAARRLQGFALHESPPPHAGGLDRHTARGSPGFFVSSRALSLCWHGRAFTRPPLTGFVADGSLSRRRLPRRVLPPARSAHLSRDCRPSWTSPTS
jgi:hypothetical protein